MPQGMRRDGADGEQTGRSGRTNRANLIGNFKVSEY
jgi:hypothetical protein